MLTNHNIIKSCHNIKNKEKREALLENPKPRKVIILSSDKADTIELYRDKVFKMIPNLTFYRIDESEFPGGIHHLKYLNIKKLNLDTTKKKDFGYWGTSKRFKIDMTSEMKDYKVKDYFANGKIVRYGTEGAELKTKFVEPLYIGKESKDERHIILKQIYEDESISNNLIGYFKNWYSADILNNKQMYQVITFLNFLIQKNINFLFLPTVQEDRFYPMLEKYFDTEKFCINFETLKKHLLAL